MHTVNKIKEDYGDQVDFVTIYLCEAHAKDQWPLGRHVQVEQHKTIHDRIRTATNFMTQTGYALPMVVDCMGNDFMWRYFAHPERFFVFENGKLSFKAQPDGAYYRLEHLTDHLDRILKR